jgi:hypothetical protein
MELRWEWVELVEDHELLGYAIVSPDRSLASPRLSSSTPRRVEKKGTITATLSGETLVSAELAGALAARGFSGVEFVPAESTHPEQGTHWNPPLSCCTFSYPWRWCRRCRVPDSG